MVRLNRALLGGSLVLLITFNIFNFLNFIFQFAMARTLSPADYSILAVLFSIIYMTGILSEPIQTIIAKYSAGENDKGKLKNIISRSFRKSIKISSILFGAYLLLSILLANLLNIPYLLISSVGLMIFAAFFPPITRGMLQGRKLFTPLGFNLVSEGIVKLGIAVLLVSLGFAVYGAMAAAILGSLCAFLLSLFSLRKIIKSQDKQTSLKEIYSYSWPVFVILLALWAFFSLDVIIARIVFSENTAGYYAFASTLAKMIFLATQPISRAMFPLAAEKKQPKGHPLLVNALVIISLCILAALAVFYFFPEFLVSLFTGKIIPESISILFYVAIAVSLVAITNLILLYKLSIGKTRHYFIFLVFPVIEVLLLTIFSHNLVEYSIALIVSAAIFLWGTIVLLDK